MRESKIAWNNHIMNKHGRSIREKLIKMAVKAAVREKRALSKKQIH
jgi:hypothetical protein